MCKRLIVTAKHAEWSAELLQSTDKHNCSMEYEHLWVCSRSSTHTKDTEHTNDPIIMKSVVLTIVGPGPWTETIQWRDPRDSPDHLKGVEACKQYFLSKTEIITERIPSGTKTYRWLQNQGINHNERFKYEKQNIHKTPHFKMSFTQLKELKRIT